MSKYIDEHSLSVGYNVQNGQDFFDMLSMFEDYIYDYFFGISESIAGNRFDSEYEIKQLERLDTYGFPANLLFNNHLSYVRTGHLINIIKTIVNLKSVTVLNPMDANEIKYLHPELEVHLSVRFWDWGRFPNPIARVKELAEYDLDVINISGAYSYNDYALIDEIHKYGMKVKFIANEGCIIRKDFNYSQFPGYEDKLCRVNPFARYACFSECINLIHDYPWLEMCRINIYKESLKYYKDHKLDILKLSGRHRSVERMIKYLTYWTSDDNTSLYLPSCEEPIDISNKYDLFLEYLEDRSKCKGNCWECQKCKMYYNEFKNT